VPGLDLSFELPAAGFFAATVGRMGLAGAGACAVEADANAHAVISTVASFRARGNEASMAADSTRRRLGPR
jgi:hypothetical protein